MDSKIGKEDLDTGEHSNVYPRQANDLASLQTIIIQIFVKSVFREGYLENVVEC